MPETTTIPTVPTIPTAAALRRARELTGLSCRSAARQLGLRRSVLRRWENGTATPDGDELARAIALYSRDLDQAWPDREPLVSPDEPDVLVVGDERIELSELIRRDADGVETIDNRRVLTRYVAAVRRQRNLGPSDTLELRASDLSSLASVLDPSDTEIEQMLAELLDLTPAGARWTTRTLLVSSLMAIGATTLAGTSWASPAGASASVATAPAPAVALAPEVLPGSVQEHRALLFAPAELDLDLPIDVEVVTSSEPTGSPFSVDPNDVPVELAPAVFATAPASEWSYVDEVIDAQRTPIALPPAPTS